MLRDVDRLAGVVHRHPNVRPDAQGWFMQEPSTNEIVTFTCRHDEYLRHLEEREQVPYNGPEAHCADCGDQIQNEEPVVHEDGELICYECHNDALAWAMVFRCGS